MNYEFNLTKWLPRFPLKESDGRYYGCGITSPSHLCNIEWLRRGLQDEYKWGKAVPVDLFVMSLGEPRRRSATKIGGLPYRSRRLPWPESSEEEPLGFIGQLNFTNSLDLVGKLPGDLLLVFGDKEFGCAEPLHLEWQNIGLRDLVRPDDVPKDCFRCTPCYGNRCRMLSYPQAVRRSRTDHLLCHGKEVWSHYYIPQFLATQIGRAPFFIQQESQSHPGQMLCTINSVCPDSYEPYPWVNFREPLAKAGTYRRHGKELMIMDSGCIHISLKKDGILHYDVEYF